MRPEDIQEDIARSRRALSEPLTALERKVSPQQLMEQTMDTFRDMGMNTRMAHVVRENPVPLALLGVGLGWLVYNSMRDRGEWHGSSYAGSRQGLGYGSDHATGYEGGEGLGYASSSTTGYGAGSEYGTTGGTTYATGAGTSYSGQGYGDQGQQAYQGGGSYQGDNGGQGRASAMRDRASQMAGSVRERTTQIASTARERVSTLASTARDRMSSMSHSMRGQADSLSVRSRDTFQEHPLMVGSVALLVGAALGAALPRSRYENRWMGEARDNLMNNARDMGSGQWERAKSVASRVADVARDHAGQALDDMKHVAKEEVGQQKNLGGMETSSRLPH